MSVSIEQKSEVIKKFQINSADTGSARVQVALITQRMNDLQAHFVTHKKDNHSRRGLLQLVGRRRSLLDYIKSKDIKEYRSLIEELGLRK